MNDDLFLEGAVARYKGFLYLIKKNREMSINRFCVPTYDIDLIWHSHQLHPATYCTDLVKILGKVLEHDDTDSDSTKGKKLNVGFSQTTNQWEETFGLRYWRAGAMYRGKAPSPINIDPYLSKMGKSGGCEECGGGNCGGCKDGGNCGGGDCKGSGNCGGGDCKSGGNCGGGGSCKGGGSCSHK